MEYIKGQESPDFDTKKVNTYLDFFTEFMLNPRTYTIVHEGVQQNLWVVAFTETVRKPDGYTIIVKCALYSYN